MSVLRTQSQDRSPNSEIHIRSTHFASRAHSSANTQLAQFSFPQPSPSETSPIANNAGAIVCLSLSSTVSHHCSICFKISLRATVAGERTILGRLKFKIGKNWSNLRKAFRVLPAGKDNENQALEDAVYCHLISRSFYMDKQRRPQLTMISYTSLVKSNSLPDSFKPSAKVFKHPSS